MNPRRLFGVLIPSNPHAPGFFQAACHIHVAKTSLASLREQVEKLLEHSREWAVKSRRVHAQMRKAFAGVLSRSHAAVAAVISCCSRFDEDGRFSPAVLIVLGILSGLMMAFPLLLP
jgi:hypothetical protein